MSASTLLLAFLVVGQPLPEDAPDPRAEALSLIDAGLALTASRGLARLLSMGETATPDLILLAARAYEATRHWTAVRRLLIGRAWLDSVQGGAGRLALARAMLEMDSLSAALKHYELYLGGPGRAGSAARMRLAGRIGYARALLRSGRRVQAADQFESAASESPEVASWLLLSALQARSEGGDTAGARALAGKLLADHVVPGDSVRRELALAAFRAGDPSHGLAAAAELAPRARSALAAQWTAPARLARGDTTGAIRELRAALEERGANPEVGRLLLVLDSGTVVLRAVAESDRRAGRAGRAAVLLRRLIAGAPPERRAVLALRLAEARFRAGAYREVSAGLAGWLGRARSERVTPGGETLGEMWFLVGRARYRGGQRERAVDAWREAASRPGPNAPYASFLVADVAHEDGDLDAARQGYEGTLLAFPRSSFAGTALFRLAMLDFLEGDHETAAGRLADYQRRFPAGNWYRAAAYWEARAREMMGDSAAARRLYRELAHDPVGYYGIRAALRSGDDPWRGLPASGSTALPGPDHRTLIDRMSLLQSLGWKGRALIELREARHGRAESAEDRLRLAEALNAAGWTWQGSAIARGLHRTRGRPWSLRLIRAAYPLRFRRAIEAVSARERLDPALVSGLVHRESIFDSRAVSTAGAVGLMQLIPRTARALAGQVGLSEFSLDQLVVPEVNMTLGSRYLRDLLDRFGSLAAALASYNAGPHRLVRWRQFPEFKADEELFIERIPFSETRRYLKAVYVAVYVYRRLYGLEGASVDGREDGG
ncbi:MAG: transglycosylase SLT domain-containing protein [Gemmatimonadota bacterium]